LRQVLQAAGGDLSHVVQLCRFIVDMEKHQDAINAGPSLWGASAHQHYSGSGAPSNGPTSGARINRRGGGAGVNPVLTSPPCSADIELRMPAE
jgi:hypothetical protein